MGVNSNLYVGIGVRIDEGASEFWYDPDGFSEVGDYESQEQYDLAKTLNEHPELSVVYSGMGDTGFIGKILYESEDGRYDEITFP